MPNFWSTPRTVSAPPPPLAAARQEDLNDLLRRQRALAWIIHARPERAAGSSHSACPGWLLARRKRTRLAHWYTRPPTFSSSRRKVSSCRRAGPALTSQRRKVSSNQ